MEIKTAYSYYDEKNNIYNMFIFIEFCSIGFCIQRVSDNTEIFYIENMLMSTYYGAISYIYEDIALIPLSIQKLKQQFESIKEIPISNDYKKYISCFSCFSCNYFEYILSLIYNDMSECDNLIKYGIYYDCKVLAIKRDTELTELQDCLKYREKYIIKNNNDLSEKIQLLISSGYNYDVFSSDPKYYCDYVCKTTGNVCREDDLYNKNIFHCIDCYDENNCDDDYSLCKKHNTIENILEHCKNKKHLENKNFLNIEFNTIKSPEDSLITLNNMIKRQHEICESLKLI